MRIEGANPTEAAASESPEAAIREVANAAAPEPGTPSSDQYADEGRTAASGSASAAP